MPSRAIMQTSPHGPVKCCRPKWREQVSGSHRGPRLEGPPLAQAAFPTAVSCWVGGWVGERGCLSTVPFSAPVSPHTEVPSAGNR